ncbi:ABC transporter permease [Virgibacillus sp. MSJ-26]|uniref:ABC transporter permease n=1 Tax=Virgibacillus sp. MSJ-26 TaxID=2841522 RepID=UPI001C0F6C4E|nr:ABC transporter permease [Virgibacillus sp. MSJ-26]MBU5468722.1 ABC transporter permease [Virgibacillus sp. MSJ-26]
MAKLISIELYRNLNFKNSIIIAGLILIPIIYNIYRIDQFSLVNSLDLFSFNMSVFLPFLFPLLVVLIYAQPFSNELSNNYITYTRVRIDFKKYILIKLISNSILVFLSFFVVVFIIFLFSYYIEPHLGFVNYEPENINLTTEGLLDYDISMFTFTQLIKYSTLLYGLTYSGWVALNAVLYSSMAMLATLLFRNTFVALSIPFLFYHIGSFIIAVLGFPMFLLDASIFPFNVEQQPIYIAFIPFLFVVGVTGSMFFRLLNNINNKRFD